jgi:predicted NUDIX family NTP pyrophosphohydrolase
MKISAGILLYRFKNNKTEVFLVHPGGPFWKNKDAGAWSVPKGEIMPGEDNLAAAKEKWKKKPVLWCQDNL